MSTSVHAFHTVDARKCYSDSCLNPETSKFVVHDRGDRHPFHLECARKAIEDANDSKCSYCKREVDVASLKALSEVVTKMPEQESFSSEDSALDEKGLDNFSFDSDSDIEFDEYAGEPGAGVGFQEVFEKQAPSAQINMDKELARSMQEEQFGDVNEYQSPDQINMDGNTARQLQEQFDILASGQINLMQPQVVPSSGFAAQSQVTDSCNLVTGALVVTVVAMTAIYFST